MNRLETSESMLATLDCKQARSENTVEMSANRQVMLGCMLEMLVNTLGSKVHHPARNFHLQNLPRSYRSRGRMLERNSRLLD